MYDQDDITCVIYEDGVLSLSGVIHPYDVSAALVRKVLSGVSGPLTVSLNSGGGSATEGVAIFNLLRAYADKYDGIIVEVDGVAASAASIIFMAGDIRTVKPGGIVMIHEPWLLTMGPANQLRRDADMLDKHTDAYAQVYAERSGMDEAEVRSLMAEETWMSGQDAREMGFATDDGGEPATDPEAFAYGLYRHAPEALLGVAITEAELSAQLQGRAIMPLDKKAAASTAVQPASTPDNGPDLVVAERQRTSDILALCAKADIAAKDAQAMIADGLSLSDAQARVIDIMADRRAQPGDAEAALPSRATMVGTEQSEKFASAIVEGQLARYGVKGAKANEFTGHRLSDMARTALVEAGHRAPNASDKVIETAIRIARADAGIRHNGADFPKLVENIADKAVISGYNETDENYRRWCVIGTLNDFRPSGRAAIDAFPNLVKYADNGEITYGSVGDRGEKLQLGSYGRIIGLTRKTIVNDDLGEIIRMAQSAGRSASRLEGDLAYGVLTTNANMDDGNALFSAAHTNIATGGDRGAPSVTSLAWAETALATQTIGDATVGTIGRFLLVPNALRPTAAQLMASEHDPAKTSRAANPYRDYAEVIADHRLQAASATGWYLLGDPSLAPVVEVAFLAGQQTPMVDQKDGWTVDGVEFRVRHDVAAGAIDFRGGVYNPNDA